MLRQLIIKIFAKLVLWLGMVFGKRRHRYDLSAVKKVLVNKTDRIGDAVVTFPLLLELAKKFKVTVLTSKYNDVFLRDFFETIPFIDKPLDFGGVVRMIARNFFLVFKRSRTLPPKYDLYLDLDGIKELNVFLKVREDNWCRHYVSFNMGIGNLLLDYSSGGYTVLFSRRHILESYKEFIKNTLGVDLDIPDYMDFSDKMIKSPDFNEAGYILVNIGGAGKFRGPTLKVYARIVNSLATTGKIVVMDEVNNPNLDEFKSYIERDNIRYLDRNFSLWELFYIAAKSLVYVGSDSGISNFLQMPTNAVLFFANVVPWVWRPYSRNPYERRKKDNVIIEETKNSKGLIKKVIYRRVWCRPCFDIGCRKPRCMLGLKAAVAIEEINSLMEEVTKECLSG